MDCLPLGMHAFLVPLIFCVLHHVTCQPYMPQQIVYDYQMGLPEMQPRFLMPGMYQPFNSYQQQRTNYFDNWNRRDTAYRRKQHAPRQYEQRQRTRPQLNDVQPRREIIRPRTRRPAVQTRQKPVYQYHTRPSYSPIVNSRRTQTPKVVTRSPIKPQRTRTIRKKPTVVTGILTNVVPHPKQRLYDRMSAKKRARFRAVATAKSFPGIIKNTALENKNK